MNHLEVDLRVGGEEMVILIPDFLGFCRGYFDRSELTYFTLVISFNGPILCEVML